MGSLRTKAYRYDFTFTQFFFQLKCDVSIFGGVLGRLVKRDAIEMEERITRERTAPVERPVNIDPGLINDCRIILASTKDYSHRLYRGDGIWEEITLMYRDGAYGSLPWTYRDFTNPGYHEFFEVFRDRVIAEL